MDYDSDVVIMSDTDSSTDDEGDTTVEYTPDSSPQPDERRGNRVGVPDVTRPANPVPPHSPTFISRAIDQWSRRTQRAHEVIDHGGGPAGGATGGERAGDAQGEPRPSTSGLDSSVAEFKSPKKYKPDPVETVTSATASTTDAMSDSDECPICMDEWSNSGAHRLSSLKCGHLFGKSCIEKWLREHKPGSCPQCKAKATKNDIRPIFAKSLRTVDTSERDEVQRALEAERKARKAAELEAANSRLRLQAVQEEMKRMQDLLERNRQLTQNLRMAPAGDATSSQASGTHGNGAPRYVFDRILKIWEPGSCRVMAYDAHSMTLSVSQPSASPLFPGFGIKKINTMDFRTNRYVSIHQKMIRDMALNPGANDGLLLTASLDKTVKVTSLASCTVVQTYTCTFPLWACAWNPDNMNLFYTGLINGRVNVYDIRNTSEPLSQINTEGQGSPVVSLQYIQADPQSAFRPGGLVVGRLNKSMFYEHKTNGDYAPHALPMENQMMCLNLDNKSRHLLASYRPTQKCPNTRHMVYQMTADGAAGAGTVCRANKIHTLHGGGTQKMLTRSKLVPHPEDPSRLLVCSGDEASLSVNVWDTTTGDLCQKISTQAEVLDLTAVTVNRTNYLAALTEKNVHLYKWTR